MGDRDSPRVALPPSSSSSSSASSSSPPASDVRPPSRLSLSMDSPTRANGHATSPSGAMQMTISSPSKLRMQQQQMTLSAIPEAAPMHPAAEAATDADAAAAASDEAVASPSEGEERQEQQQYLASAASASAAAASAIAAAASPFATPERGGGSSSSSNSGGLPPLSPQPQPQPQASPALGGPSGSSAFTSSSICSTPVSGGGTADASYPRSGGGLGSRCSTTPNSSGGPGSGSRAALGVPAGYATLRGGVGGGAGGGLTAAVAMGSRQPSAPTTPANPRGLLRPPSSSRSAHSSPANGGTGTLLPPAGPGLLRRPSVSLLPSAGELDSPGVSMSRAPSASAAGSRTGAVRSGQTVHEPSAFARPDAMISYSRKDIAFVRLLYQHFENAGRSVWVDFYNIPKAVDFMESIRAGIREANSFIYIISPDSVASKYCDAELDFAIECGKRIIPIVVREVQPVEKVRPEIQSLNWIFCCTTSNAAVNTAGGKAPAAVPPSMHLHQVFPHILDSVLIDPQYVLMHTKLLVRAMEWEAAGEDASFLATGRELEEANRWVAKSNAYALHHKQHAERLRAQAQAQKQSGTGALRSAANAAALVSAPMPTRIQKLFIFASNERVLLAHKKEQMLLRFLEDDEEEEEEEDEMSPLACDSAASDAQDDDDGANYRAIDVDEFLVAEGNGAGAGGGGAAGEVDDAPLNRSNRTPAKSSNAPNSFEHGSLAGRKGATMNGASASARKVSSSSRGGGGSSAPRVSSSDLHATPSRSRNSSGQNGGGGGGGGGGAGTRTPRLASTHTPLHRVLPHLSVRSSRYAAFHRSGGLRSLLHTQEQLMHSFMHVVQERQQQRTASRLLRERQGAHSKQLQVQFDEAATSATGAAAAAPEGDLEAPPSQQDAAAAAGGEAVAGAGEDASVAPLTGGDASSDGQKTSWSARFERARYAAFTAHESLVFHRAFLALLAVETFLLFLTFVLVLSGAAGPDDGAPSSYPVDNGASAAIRPLRVLLAITLSFFFVEMVVFVMCIHWGVHRMARQPVYLVSMVMLICVAALEGASWDCLGLQRGRTNDPAFSHASCANNALVWSLLLRSWMVLLRGLHSCTLRPLHHSLHSLHVSLVHARAVVSKLKRMVRILNGEIVEKENISKRKWELLKRAHPSRRFSKVGGTLGPAGFGPGAAAANGSGGGGGGGANTPSGLVAPVAPSSSSCPSRARRTDAGYSTLPRNSSRGSTISPGAYGGATTSSARMYSSRQSVLLQSPSGSGGLANKYDTMPLRKMPAPADSVLAAAASAATAIAVAESGAEEIVGVCEPPSVSSPTDNAPLPDYPTAIHVNGEASQASHAGASAAHPSQHTQTHPVQSLPPHIQMVQMAREGSDSAPFMLRTPPHAALNAAKSSSSRAHSPTPSPSSNSHSVEGGGDAHASSRSASDDTAAPESASSSAAPSAGVGAGAGAGVDTAETANGAPPRKTHRPGGRRGRVPHQPSSGTPVLRVHADPMDASTAAAAVRAVCFPDGSGASASLASQAFDSGLLLEGLTDSQGGVSSVLSGLSALSAGMSMDGGRGSAPVSPMAAGAGAAGSNGVQWHGRDEEAEEDEDEEEHGGSESSSSESPRNDQSESESEDEDEEAEEGEWAGEDAEAEAERGGASSGADLLPGDSAAASASVSAPPPAAATVTTTASAAFVASEDSSGLDGSISVPLSSSAGSSGAMSTRSNWPAPSVQLLSPPTEGAPSATSGSSSSSSMQPQFHSTAPDDILSAPPVDYDATAAADSAAALALTTPPSVFSPRSAPSCTPIDESIAQPDARGSSADAHAHAEQAD